MPKFKLTIVQHKIVGHPYIPICKFQIIDLTQNESISTDYINPPLYKSNQLPSTIKKKQNFPISILLDCQQNTNFLIYLYQLTANGRQVKIGHTKITLNEDLMNKKTKHRIFKGFQKDPNKNNVQTFSILQIIITRSEFRNNSKDSTRVIGSGRLNKKPLHEQTVEEDSSQNSQKADSNQNVFQSEQVQDKKQEELLLLKKNIEEQKKKYMQQSKINLPRTKYQGLNNQNSQISRIQKYDQNNFSKEQQQDLHANDSLLKKRRTGYTYHPIKKEPSLNYINYQNKSKQKNDQHQQQQFPDKHKRIKYFKHIKNANLVKNIRFFINNDNNNNQNYHDRISHIGKEQQLSSIKSQSLTFLTYQFYEIIAKVLPKTIASQDFQQYFDAQIKLPEQNFVIRIQLILDNEQVYSGTIGNQQGSSMKTVLRKNRNNSIQKDTNIHVVFDIEKYAELPKHKEKQSIINMKQFSSKQLFTNQQSLKYKTKKNQEDLPQFKKKSFTDKTKQLQEQKISLIKPWRFPQASPYNVQNIQNVTSQLKKLLKINSQQIEQEKPSPKFPKLYSKNRQKSNSKKKIFSRKNFLIEQQRKKQKMRKFVFLNDKPLQKTLKSDSEDSNYLCRRKLQKIKIQNEEIVEKMEKKFNSRSNKKIKQRSNQKLKMQSNLLIRKSLQGLKQVPKISISQAQQYVSVQNHLKKTVSRKFLQSVSEGKKNRNKLTKEAQIQMIKDKKNQKVLTLQVIQSLATNSRLTLQIKSIKLVKQLPSHPAFTQSQQKQKPRDKPIFFKIYVQGKKSHSVVTSSSKQQVLEFAQSYKKIKNQLVLEESYYQWFFQQTQIFFDKITKDDFLIIQAFYDVNLNDYQQNIGKCIISANQFLYLSLKKQLSGYLIHKSKVAGKLFAQFHIQQQSQNIQSGRRNLNRWQF